MMKRWIAHSVTATGRPVLRRRRRRTALLDGFSQRRAGVFMVLVYGVMLGVIRRRSSGLLAPWIAHVMADIAFFPSWPLCFFKAAVVLFRVEVAQP